jgi:hypothetical protein
MRSVAATRVASPDYDFLIDFRISPRQTEGVFAEDQQLALAVIASL